MVSKMKNCHDCGAKPGELHKEGCDSPRCTICGIQLLQCEHYPEGNSVHTGIELQELKIIAEVLDLYCRYDAERGLVPCSEQADGANYDLNKVGEIYQFALQTVRLKESE